ncbi:LURP-one-related/scramblase family protein [Croceimicrobium hydrocarbonivorans]|uniref:Uncharacterized protein n=1 Tax=Croceimicrobium hydrocarbonivorans TaxID=2761580 RepID=A0A7H0VHF5_9FLAO|nr:hypothetical protein [Croceimicrobium hydrocarbonivorans]QNR25153.1 hypothetical protein H4K34_04760 [Croceimicrobium hydrocarbonivorans]
MTIDINQHQIAIGDRYNIYVDQEFSYKARVSLFRLFLAEIILSNTEGALVAKIERKFNWLNAKYSITGLHPNVLTFRTRQIWKMHFACQLGPDRYEIYGHKGRRVSVFLNEQQVAYFDKAAVSWFNGDNYKIVANDDCDPGLLICFVLIWDNFFSSKSEGNTVTFDFGNIGLEARKFDENWIPKKIKN